MIFLIAMLFLYRIYYSRQTAIFLLPSLLKIVLMSIQRWGRNLGFVLNKTVSMKRKT